MARKKTEEIEEAENQTTEAQVEDPSFVENVIDTVASAVGAVAETVSGGASALVSAVAGEPEKIPTERKKGKRAEKVGIVSSDKMTKTVVVLVDRLVKHPVYRKYIRKRKKFMAHDEKGAKVGDKVRIVETRPLSARKRWRVAEIIQRAEM